MSHQSLTREAFRNVAGFLIALWLVLFLPAWTLWFPEAWVYWLLFSIMVIMITAWFLKTDPELIGRRLRAGPGAERERSQKRIQSFTALCFLALLILPGLDRRFMGSHMPLPLVLAGDLLVIIGFVIVFLTFRKNRYTSAIIEVNEGQTVISTGPYAVVRHPMYTGATLLLAGTPLALGSPWAVVPAVLAICGIIWRLIDEERYLSLHLPGYREYCLRTRFRLVPFVW